MKKVIVIQTATEHPEANYYLFSCNTCEVARKNPCFTLVPKIYPGDSTPFGCQYAYLESVNHDVNPDWQPCNGNFQIMEG